VERFKVDFGVVRTEKRGVVGEKALVLVAMKEAQVIAIDAALENFILFFSLSICLAEV